MHIFKEIGPLRAFLGQKRTLQNIGFVPTMGALHEGHISLLAASKAENDLSVCSIYINPAQFNNAADLEKYPRTVEADLALLEKSGCDVVFIPSNKEMYETTSIIKFDFGQLDKIMEGKFRPGHFSGVALVVSKLFNVVDPTIAYFGQKDFQQFKIIEQLVKELKFNLQLKCMPILREKDGLAMSSRNQRLTAEQRKKAIVFFESLILAKELLSNGQVLSSVKEQIKIKCEAVEGVKLEYLELADSKNLTLAENVTSENVLLIAGYVGEIRLIDNILMHEN
jgi:pantoate--beta-alanine ligase